MPAKTPSEERKPDYVRCGAAKAPGKPLTVLGYAEKIRKRSGGRSSRSSASWMRELRAGEK